MSGAPDISVIVAAHNVGPYIARAVMSALGQDGVAVEVIVVDDGSTDSTRAALSRIADPRVRRVDLPENRGPGAARNAGIAHATAPWIAILDGDDAFASGRLARCLARARLLSADIVVDNIEVRREADDARFPMFVPRKFARMEALDLARFIAGNVFFRGGYSLGYLKPVFSMDFLRRNKIAYDSSLRIGEDYLFMCEALACGARCALEPSIGYLYTARKGSTSHRISSGDIERIIEGDRAFLARHKLDPKAAKVQKRRAASLGEAHAFAQLVAAIKQRDATAALRAFAAHPLAARHLREAAWVRMKRPFAKAKRRTSHG
ncbi:MAG TPA: glycosyltransferase family 2 protein [Alphaproteobacteria bacterium]|nr:glycosyltransferase family 2 protein [Alphaproteobacteria bacterium]